MNKSQMIELLRKDVVPALGCTEPVCVALCAANAGLVVEGKIESIDVKVNDGIYKNGMSAGIPNCEEVGLPWAAAIGAILKNPEKGLELLADLTPALLQQAARLLAEDKVNVSVKEDERSLYVKCVIKTEREESTCLIRDAHTNVILLKKNEEIIF